MAKAYTDCDTCGTTVWLVWDGEGLPAWTGRCETCGDILWATKNQVRVLAPQKKEEI